MIHAQFFLGFAAALLLVGLVILAIEWLTRP